MSQYHSAKEDQNSITIKMLLKVRQLFQNLLWNFHPLELQALKFNTEKYMYVTFAWLQILPQLSLLYFHDTEVNCLFDWQQM